MAIDDSPSGSIPERGVWSTEEHDKFIQAITKYPHGPWKNIADFVGTRSVRQVQTHAQKYQEKVARRERGLQKNRQKVVRMEHRVDEATYGFVNRPRAAKGRKAGSKKNSTSTTTTTTTSTTASTCTPMTRMMTSMSTSTTFLTPCHEMSAPPVDLWASVDAPTHDALMAMPSPLSLNMMELLDSLPGSPMDVDSSPNLFKEPLMSPPNELLQGHLDLDSPPSLTRRPRPSVTVTTVPMDDRKVYVADRKAPCACPPTQDVPTINESLDFFLRVMSIWPKSGAHSHAHY